MAQSKTTLKIGFTIRKYAKNGVKPHERLLQLSEDDSKLCWKEPNKKDIKFELLNDIQQIKEGIEGPGFKKHLKKGDYAKIENQACVILGKDNYSMEFEFKDKITRDNFLECLRFVIDKRNYPNNNVLSQKFIE